MTALPMLLLAASLLQSGHGESFVPLCSKTCTPADDMRDNTYPKYSCSCSNSCATLGDCCYDSPHKHTERPSPVSFVCLPVADRSPFLAVASCPSDKNLGACRGSLGSQPPVTSRTTNITYGSIVCASCNGDGDDVVTWDVEFKCPPGSEVRGRRSVFDLYDFQGLSEEYKSEKLCKFHAPASGLRLLEGLELRSCISPEKVSACSMSWRDRSVAEKCRSYEDPVFVEDKLFRNRHCAECNYQRLAELDCIPASTKRKLEKGTVKLSDLQSCMANSSSGCNFDDYKGEGYTLSKILNIDQQGCVPPPGRRCCPGERFLSATNSCRKTRT